MGAANLVQSTMVLEYPWLATQVLKPHREEKKVCMLVAPLSLLSWTLPASSLPAAILRLSGTMNCRLSSVLHHSSCFDLSYLP